MKGIIKKIFLYFMIIISLLFIFKSSTYALTDKIIDNDLTPSKNNKYNSYDYVIDKYDVNIIVNENNTFDITETITAYFNSPKHGIIRTIPLKNKITRLDETIYNNRAKVSNLSVNKEYIKSIEDDTLKIEIGSLSNTLQGEQTYVIKYTYNLGKDFIKDYDILYYSIIGNNWNTVIGNITFSIVMPKEFDLNKLEFSLGKYRLINNVGVNYSIDGNTIVGNYNGILKEHESLIVKCILPEDYFVGASLNIDFMDIMKYIMFLIPIIFLCISIFLLFKNGNDVKTYKNVELYPPQELSSLEVGFLYKGNVKNNDIASLIISLSNKGYLKIVNKESSKNKKNKNNKFIIRKLKDYDGINNNEKLFMEELFEHNRIEVTEEMLHNNFYINNSNILYNINMYKDKMFENYSSKKNFMILMIIIIYLLITLLPILKYGKIFPDLFFALFFPLFIMSIFLSFIEDFDNIFERIISFIIGVSNSIVFLVFMLFPILTQNTSYLIYYNIGIICIVCIIICLNHFSKKTKYGNEMFRKVSCFKRFIETVDKEKLEEMVKQNPNYFYDVLSYAYVLGISNKLVKKFNSIPLQTPIWYESNIPFDIMTFDKFINYVMSSIKSAMSSK